jgi:RNA polymerase sigma-70 factor (ECF subfamily)
MTESVLTRTGRRRPPHAAPDDHDAYLAAVVEANQMAVYAYLRSRLVQVSDAEDLTQEVFLRYFDGLARFDDTRLLRPYLLGIARNLLRERARALRKRNEVSWTELCLDLEALCAEDEDRYGELLARLPGCLERLGQRPRLALEWHYRLQLKFKEIAQRLRRTTGAVKLLVFRARQSLKRCLEQGDNNQAQGS